jgi:hypothetical protein
MTLIFRVISTGLLLSRLLIPLNITVKDFWSVIGYDIQTRSMLQTDQEAPSVSSQDQGFKLNADGSVSGSANSPSKTQKSRTEQTTN